MMKTIDRYTVKMFLEYFIGGLLIFVTLFIAIDAMSALSNYTMATGSDIARYYLYLFPEIVQKMIPVSCLLGTVLTLSTLNRQQELVSLFASGMSLLRICFPLLVAVALVSGLNYVVADRILPITSRTKNYILYADLKKEPHRFSTVKTNKIWYRSKNAIFNIKTLNKEGSKAQGLTIYFFDDAWNLIQMVTARDVKVEGSRWDLEQGALTLFNAESSFPLTQQFTSKTIQMTEDVKDLMSSGQTSDLLTQEELARFIAKNKEAGLDTLTYEVDYHGKMSFAVSGLILCLLGIPFSLSGPRSGGHFVNAGICLGLVFVFYVLYSSGITLGQHGTLPPIVAAWAPEGLMLAFATLLLKRTKK